MPSFGNVVVKMLDGLVQPSSLLPYTGDWIPDEHLDRLRQYEVFRALNENRFGRLLKDKSAGKKLREYGDYQLIVETSRDAVLGDRIGIEVPGASDESDAGAVTRKKLLDAWAERERFASKVYRCESDAAAVGDCVYELRPDGTRLRLRAHDPESFFPVWENGEGDFSEGYLAWEEVNNGQYLPTAPSNLKDLRNRDGDVVLYRRHYQVLPVEAAREVGVELRGAAERKEVCVVTAAWYRIETKGGDSARGLAHLERLGFELLADGTPIESLDTGFDEVPLFYVPNKEATGQPWGLPEGDSILQVLLDAAQDHTDLKENTFYNAFPPLYDKNQPAGATPPKPGQAPTPSQQAYKPGQIYNGRDLGAVDLSNGNKLLLEHVRFLIDKALSNSRTTHIAAGMLQPGEIPSGVALMIALLPLMAKTLPKRQTRRDKLGMMLKHVLRWHRDFARPADFGMAGEGWPEAMWSDLSAFPTFGSMLPIDKKQVSEIVAALLNAQAISTETAVMMLQAAGFPIDDAAEEVERIKSESRLIGAPGSGFGTQGVAIPGIGDTGEEEAA